MKISSGLAYFISSYLLAKTVLEDRLRMNAKVIGIECIAVDFYRNLILMVSLSWKMKTRHTSKFKLDSRLKERKVSFLYLPTSRGAPQRRLSDAQDILPNRLQITDNSTSVCESGLYETQCPS